jgi:hypothetical protein
MSIAEKMARFNPKEWFTVRGSLSFSNTGVVTINFEEGVYAIVEERDIHPDFVFPLDIGDDPSGRGSQHAIKLKQGSKVQLHYKGIDVMFFTNFTTQRQFYICPEQMKLVYLDQLSAESKEVTEWRNCNKRVYVVDAHCCRNNKYCCKGYGGVGCPNEGEDAWTDERCCPNNDDDDG